MCKSFENESGVTLPLKFFDPLGMSKAAANRGSNQKKSTCACGEFLMQKKVFSSIRRLIWVVLMEFHGVSEHGGTQDDSNGQLLSKLQNLVTVSIKSHEF